MSRSLEHIYDLTGSAFILDNSTEERSDRVFADTRNLANVKQYRAAMNADDGWYNISEARVLVEYNVKTDGVPPTTTTGEESFMLPSVWGLFSQVRLSFNQKNVATANEPNTQHHIWSAATMSADYALNQARNTGYYPMTSPDTSGAQFVEIGPGAAFLDHPANVGVTPAAGIKRMTPVNDHTSPVSLEMITEDDPFDFTRVGANHGKVLHNASYDRNFVDNVKRHTGSGNITVMMPLKHLFPGLSSICSHVTRGTRVEIEATKASDDVLETFYVHPRSSDSETPVATITRFELWMPLYVPSDESEAMIKSRLLDLQKSKPLPKIMQDLDLQRFSNIPKGSLKNTIKLSTDAAKVIYAFVGFQDSRKRSNLLHNPLQFENIGNLGSLSVVVNGKRFPKSPYQSNDKPRQLNDFLDIARKIGNFDTGSLVTAESYDSPFRLYAFDFTSQYDVDEETFVSDIEIDYFLQTEPANDYDVVILLVQEKELHLYAGQGKTLIRK